MQISRRFEIRVEEAGRWSHGEGMHHRPWEQRWGECREGELESGVFHRGELKRIKGEI